MTSKEAKVQFAKRAMELYGSLSYPGEVLVTYGMPHLNGTVITGVVRASENLFLMTYADFDTGTLVISSEPPKSACSTNLQNITSQELHKIAEFYSVGIYSLERHTRSVVNKACSWVNTITNINKDFDFYNAYVRDHLKDNFPEILPLLGDEHIVWNLRANIQKSPEAFPNKLKVWMAALEKKITFNSSENRFPIKVTGSYKKTSDGKDVADTTTGNKTAFKESDLQEKVTSLINDFSPRANADIESLMITIQFSNPRDGSQTYSISA